MYVQRTAAVLLFFKIDFLHFFFFYLVYSELNSGEENPP